MAIPANAPTGAGVVSGGSGALNYTVARRHPTAINTAGRTTHIYVSKSGRQTCWPEIRWSRLLSNDGADNVTCYPAGTVVSSPCTWGGTTCDTPAGTCTPKWTTTVQSAQYVTPKLC